MSIDILVIIFMVGVLCAIVSLLKIYSSMREDLDVFSHCVKKMLDTEEERAKKYNSFGVKE